MLAFAARHGRLVLIAGLVAGFALPGLARILAGYIPEMVAVIMFLGALRLSPDDLAQLRLGVGRAVQLVLLLQLVLPLALVLLFFALGLLGTPVALALILLASAPPIVGAPNIAALMGLRAGVAMQLLVIGSLLLPLTILPVFWLLPELGSFQAILMAALRLLALILLAGGGALLVRAMFLRRPSQATATRLDGASVIGLAIFVIGLMPALAGAVTTMPMTFLYWLGITCLANFGAQIVTYRLARRPLPERAGPLALVNGNRNVSLFFAALPVDITAPLLVFLGCYQLPMFLTPVLMGWLYRTDRRVGKVA